MVPVYACATKPLSNYAVQARSLVGSVAELHAIPMPTESEPAELWVMRPTLPAVAMGSSQRVDLFDQAQLVTDGVELAPRRSGGGAVFIDPLNTVWIDLVAPRSSPWWSNELVENFLIVGRVWQHALAKLGVNTDLCVESAPRTEAAALACWAGLGWGELTMGPERAKVVGLSQRRTRWGCRVQAMAVLNNSSQRVSDYLLSPGNRVVHQAIPTASVSVTPAALEAAVVAEFAATGR